MRKTVLNKRVLKEMLLLKTFLRRSVLSVLSIVLLVSLLALSGCYQKIDGDGMVFQSYRQIDQDQAKEMMKEDDGHIIVDVRRQDEYDAGHIPGAIMIPNEEIDTEQPEELPDLDQIILIYCRSGRRSKEAAQKLADMGYTRIYEFGGIIDWSGETVVADETFAAEETEAVDEAFAVEETVTADETFAAEETEAADEAFAVEETVTAEGAFDADTEDAPMTNEVVLHMDEIVLPEADWRFTAQTEDGTELVVHQAVFHGQDITLTVDEFPKGETVLVEQTVEEKAEEPETETAVADAEAEDTAATETGAAEEAAAATDADANAADANAVDATETDDADDATNAVANAAEDAAADLEEPTTTPGTDSFNPRYINIGHTDPEIVGQFEKVQLADFTHTNDQGEEQAAEFVYYIYVPEEAKTSQVPILFALNGMGECGTNGSNLTAYRMATCWIDEAWQAEHPCIVVAPQAPVPFLNTRTGQILPDLMATYVERLKALFDELIETYHPGKVYLTGVSMGAMTSYRFLSTYPDYPIDASLLCCGFADESDPSPITGRTILIATDSADATVNPANVLATYNALADSGANDITLVYSYMNYGHAIWDYIYDNPVYMEWLFAQ